MILRPTRWLSTVGSLFQIVFLLSLTTFFQARRASIIYYWDRLMFSTCKLTYISGWFYIRSQAQEDFCFAHKNGIYLNGRKTKSGETTKKKRGKIEESSSHGLSFVFFLFFGRMLYNLMWKNIVPFLNFKQSTSSYNIHSKTLLLAWEHILDIFSCIIFMALEAIRAGDWNMCIVLYLQSILLHTHFKFIITTV